MGLAASRLAWTIQRNPLVTLGLLVTFLFLLSLFSHPDPTSSHLQFPGLLPSRYPPTHHPSDDVLNVRLSEASDALAGVCRGRNEPIYIDPGLSTAQIARYSYLAKGSKKIMLVTTIREIQAQLPDLLNTLIVLVSFLGPKRLSFSILEGPSDDCTADALEQVVYPTLLSLGVPKDDLNIHTRESKIEFSKHNRIQVLAGLRNRALAPLWETKAGKNVEAVVMFNDVFLKATDVLEVLHQHVKSGAGISTAWDWMERDPAYYYDVWVGRTIDTGNLFYPIDNAWWSPSDKLFYDSPKSKERFDHLEPFQVYSSWNGLAILDPKPFLSPHNVRFRRGDLEAEECAASECSLVATDFWKAGQGRVQIVPSVQLAYTHEVAQQIREALDEQEHKLGWVGGVPPAQRDTGVRWVKDPPAQVRCHPWPEINGLSANVWEHTQWVDPLTGREGS